MISIKRLWAYITGNYEGLRRSVERKICDLQNRKIEDPSQEAYCTNLINHLLSELEMLDRKIAEKDGR